MTIRTRTLRMMLPACLLAAALLLGPARAVAASPDPARLVPTDTFMLVDVASVDGLMDQIKKTAIWRLYKEPAMQPFLGPAEQAIRAKIDEALKEAWRELGMENPPETLPLPTGRMALAMRMVMRTHQVPEYDWENHEPGTPPRIKGTRERKSPAPKALFLAEMGKNMPALKRIVRIAEQKAVDEGAKLRRETVRGAEMTIITPPTPKHDDGQPIPGWQPEPLCYVLKGSLGLISNDPAMLKGALVRMGGAGGDSLADDPNFRSVMRSLGDGQIRAYIGAKPLLEMAKTTGSEGATRTQTTLRALGLTNVLGLGITADFAPKPNMDARFKALLAVRGEKTGLVELLAPPNRPLGNNPLLTAGAAGFFVSNHELGIVFNQARQIVLAVGGPDIQQFTQAGNIGIDDEDLDLPRDFIGQLTRPITIVNRIKKPFTAPDASQTMIGIGVRNPDTLGNAMGIVHGTLVARGNKELSRSLLGTSIYLMPGDGSVEAAIFGGRGALAVVGNQFTLGSVTSVEQAIRDTQREDLRPIQADPVFRYAKRHLPSEAIAFFYSNTAITTEQSWAQLKALAPGVAAARGRGRTANDGLNTMTRLMVELGESCDCAVLPDFAAVRKYYGSSVGYVKDTEQGIYLEIVSLPQPDGR